MESGGLTTDQWAEKFDGILQQGHTDAYVLGRKRGGDRDPDLKDAELRARQVKDGENEYLYGYEDAEGEWHPGFVGDLNSQDPRYFDEDGEMIPGAIDARSDLYVLRMRGTAGEGFVEASPDVQIDWVLGAADHCDDCPEIADMSPYTEDTLWTHPGEGDCPCLGNCACELEREDGTPGFGRPDLDGADFEDSVKSHPLVRWFHDGLKRLIGQEAKIHAAAASPLNDMAEPTDAQKSAGNYRKGHVSVGGLDLSIENPSGSRRRPEWTPMSDHYGYVKGSVGYDKDHVDVFLKPGTEVDYAGPVFVIDQMGADGSFDEHKCMVGWADGETAQAGYLSNYGSGQASRIGGVTEMTMKDFKVWALGDGPSMGALSGQAAIAA